MQSKVRHTGLVVQDLQKMKSFYREIFGFSEKIEMKEEGPFISKLLGFENSSVTTSKLVASDQSMLELLSFHSPISNSSSEPKRLTHLGFTHMALTVDSADQVHSALKKLNLPLVSEPIVSPNGRAKVFFGRDPEGNFLEIVEELSPNVS